jgi:hypothetical protein
MATLGDRMSDSAVVFSLRLPTALDDRIRVAAETSGRSLNAEMIERLNKTFGRDTKTERVFNAFDLPEVRRIRHTNTQQALEHTLLMINTFEIERVVLAAREDPLNDAVLILLLQTANFVIILDKSTLNMARRPRELEMRQVFKALEDNGLLSEAEYVPTLLPVSTQSLPAEEMAALLMRDKTKFDDEKHLKDLLDLLAPHGQYELADFRSKKLLAKRPKKK